MKIGITGSTGHLGHLVIDHLIHKGIEAGTIIALARSREKAADLIKQGLDVRIGDYNTPQTLESAFNGVERLLLISGSDVGQRKEQHTNVVNAAKKAGVKLLVYTSIFHADTSVNPLAEEHRQTEKIIKESGIPYTILRNNWYTENYIDDIVRAKTLGYIESAAGDGSIASAARKDYAEAGAQVLIGEGHEGKTYELAGREWNFNDLAAIAADLHGREVTYASVSDAERIEHLKAAKLPQETAEFVTALDLSIKEGSLEGRSPDLVQLLGHEPEKAYETFAAVIK